MPVMGMKQLPLVILIIFLGFLPAFCGLSSCGGTSAIQGQWYLRYGSGTPTIAQTFSIPPPPGSVNYVTKSVTSVGPVLTVTLTVDAENAVYGLVDTATVGPAQVHLFLERADDESGTNPEYRWWCGSSATVLPSTGTQTLSMTCPIDPSFWTDVVGQQDSAGFQDTLDNLAWAGITFGGDTGWGHGVYLISGTSNMEIQ